MIDKEYSEWMLGKIDEDLFYLGLVIVTACFIGFSIGLVIL